jgi:hypothetical protein
LLTASEGKRNTADNDYIARPVIGLADVAAGYKPLFTTTVYQISGDDTSGIAGLLYADGTFVPSPAPRQKARYWVHEETLRYVKDPETGRVSGDSWVEGEVLWDGSVVGSINPASAEGLEEEDGSRPAVHVREFDGSLGTEWITTGELWKALERGTGMHTGPQAGRVHEIH